MGLVVTYTLHLYDVKQTVCSTFNIVHISCSKTSLQCLFQLHCNKNETICTHMPLLLHVSAIIVHLQRGG